MQFKMQYISIVNGSDISWSIIFYYSNYKYVRIHMCVILVPLCECMSVLFFSVC